MQKNYDYYRIFYHVAKCGGFTAAAAELFSNQPNITRIIKNLERELGCTLFVRSNQGVTLTPEGERLYARVKIAAECIESAERELAETKSLQFGMVSIGATEVALHCLLLSILEKYRMLYPGVKLKISNHTTPQGIAALKNGLVDFALVTTPMEKSEAFSSVPVKSIREVAVCGCGSIFSNLHGKKVSPQELIKYPIISLGKESKTYERYSEIFASYGLEFSPDIEAATTYQILPMVKSNLGIGFVPEEMIEETDGINIIELDREIPERHICLLKRSGASHSAGLGIAAAKLEELILQHGKMI